MCSGVGGQTRELEQDRQEAAGVNSRASVCPEQEQERALFKGNAGGESWKERYVALRVMSATPRH